MKDGFADVDKLSIKYYGPNFRGIHAAENIKQYDIILFLPEELVLTLDKAQNTPIGLQMLHTDIL